MVRANRLNYRCWGKPTSAAAARKISAIVQVICELLAVLWKLCRMALSDNCSITTYPKTSSNSGYSAAVIINRDFCVSKKLKCFTCELRSKRSIDPKLSTYQDLWLVYCEKQKPMRIFNYVDLLMGEQYWYPYIIRNLKEISDIWVGYLARISESMSA